MTWIIFNERKDHFVSILTGGEPSCERGPIQTSSNILFGFGDKARFKMKNLEGFRQSLKNSVSSTDGIDHTMHLIISN